MIERIRSDKTVLYCVNRRTVLPSSKMAKELELMISHAKRYNVPVAYVTSLREALLHRERYLRYKRHTSINLHFLKQKWRCNANVYMYLKDYMYILDNYIDDS